MPGRRSSDRISTYPSNPAAHFARIKEQWFTRENWEPNLSPAHSSDAYLSYERGIATSNTSGKNKRYTLVR